MKKIEALSLFVPPPVAEKPSCTSCKTFAPECLVAGKPVCWVCAHHVVEHHAALEHAYVGECACPAHEIYPGRLPLPFDVSDVEGAS